MRRVLGNACFRMECSFQHVDLASREIRLRYLFFVGSALGYLVDHRAHLGIDLLLAQVPLHSEVNRQAHSHNGCGTQHQKSKKKLDDHSLQNTRLPIQNHGVRTRSEPRHTPTGNGFGLCSSARSRTRLSKRPCNNDSSPVYQYPKTNRMRKGTVM